MKRLEHLIILACVLVIVAFVPVRTEHGYFCDYTGSFKEWTTWLWLIETDHRYQKSKLEEFVEKKHPLELQHKWISFRGTTTFLFAGQMLAHGSQGPLFYLPQTVRDYWVDAVSDDERKNFYDLLRKGDSQTIRVRIGEMEEFIQKQLHLPIKCSSSPTLRLDVEEEVEVFFLQQAGEAAFTEDVTDHEVLLVLKSPDLFLDGALGEHAVGHDGLGLADAPCSERRNSS